MSTEENSQNIDSSDSKPRNSVISIAIKDKQALYMSYMPFVENGGLFVPTKKEYNLGDEMFLLVKIMDEIEPIESKLGASVSLTRPTHTM